MSKPIVDITLLIRLSKGRKEVFRKCVESIKNQTVAPKFIYVSVDYEDYTPDFVYAGLMDTDHEVIPVIRKSQSDFFYNLYCNDLKAQVKEGFFLFLDSDDTFYTNESLEHLAAVCTDEDKVVICQFIRMGRHRKPLERYITARELKPGQFGLPCICVHSKHKALFDIGDKEGSDDLWIRQMAGNVGFVMLHEAIVSAPVRSYGKEIDI